MSTAVKQSLEVRLHADDALAARPGRVLVDAHVHFHDGYDLDAFLNAARRNMAAGAAQAGESSVVAGCLLMTESAGADCFQEWAESARASSSGPFRLTEEACSLVAPGSRPIGGPPPGRPACGCVALGPEARERIGRQVFGGVNADELSLFVIAGRQIVCAEDLEVLALLTTDRFPDGRPIRETIHAVLDAGAAAVIPWGFGKWTGRRGRIIRELIDWLKQECVFLGDNGGRPAIGRRPGLFAHAESRGWRVLPGSDPLPMASNAARVGQYGFLLSGEFDVRRPAASLRKILMEMKSSPRVLGQLESLGGFVRTQIAMQWRKRMRKSQNVPRKSE